MITPQQCYKLSKSGWVLATKIDSDPLTESLLIGALLREYGRALYYPPFIDLSDVDLGIYLDGEVYLSKNPQQIFYQAFSRDREAFARHIFKAISYRSSRLLKESERIGRANKDIAKKSTKDIASLVARYLQLFQWAVAVVSVPFRVEYALSRLLKEELRQQRLTDPSIDKVIFYLARPHKPSYAAKEKIAFRKLLTNIGRRKNLRRLFLQKSTADILAILSRRPTILAKIKAHQEQHAFLGLRWFSGEPLTLDYFIARIKQLLSEPIPVAIAARDRIRRRYRPTKNIKFLASALQTISYLRTWRLEVANKAISFIYPIFQEAARRFALSYQEFIYLTKEEIIALLNGRLRRCQAIISERNNGFGIVFDANYRLGVVAGQHLEKIKNYFSRQTRELPADTPPQAIKGVTAQNGRASGRACVVKTVREFNKFQAGDILVAQMTTPDFMTIIEKASAIVTDIGGVTCHAAIVSRELKIPCIVGAKIATKIFKTGDLVEVDAEKGVVRKLTK